MIEIKDILQIASKAGEAIMNIYNSSNEKDFEIEYKEDNSPLTIADKNSNQIICSELKKSHPQIPILSEEGASIPYSGRKDWGKFWLIDPIDGTKEFIKKNGEFTVNIALIENNTPTLGVVYAPVLNKYWYGTDKGSYVSENKKVYKININTDLEAPYRIVASRSHPSPLLKKLLDSLPDYQLVRMGSSIKICLVAEGSADIYPRLAPTMEWDTAAAHAVLKYAGGQLIDLNTNAEMVYNRENLKNSFFIANSNMDLEKLLK